MKTHKDRVKLNARRKRMSARRGFYTGFTSLTRRGGRSTTWSLQNLISEKWWEILLPRATGESHICPLQFSHTVLYSISLRWIGRPLIKHMCVINSRHLMEIMSKWHFEEIVLVGNMKSYLINIHLYNIYICNFTFNAQFKIENDCVRSVVSSC